MTQDNLFQEVQDDLDRQRYEALWQRYGIFVVLAVVAIIGGTAANMYYQARNLAAQQRATGELASIIGQSKDGDAAKEIQMLESFAENNPGQTQASLGALHAAALAAKQGNKDQAVKIYDAIAGDAKADHTFRQLADLFVAELQADSGDALQLQQRLQPLLAEKEPWRYSAMELSGYIAFRSGDKAKAKDIFTSLSQDAGVPPTLAARAGDMLRLLAEE